MMPHAIALNYADSRLRIVASSQLPSSEQLPWMCEKDFITRSIMRNYINERWPAGEALVQALIDSAADWSLVKSGENEGATLASTNESLLDEARQQTGEHGVLPWLRGTIAGKRNAGDDEDNSRDEQQSKKRRTGNGNRKRGGQKEKGWTVGEQRWRVRDLIYCKAHRTKQGCKRWGCKHNKGATS